MSRSKPGLAVRRCPSAPPLLVLLVVLQLAVMWGCHKDLNTDGTLFACETHADCAGGLTCQPSSRDPAVSVCLPNQGGDVWEVDTIQPPDSTGDADTDAALDVDTSSNTDTLDDIAAPGCGDGVVDHDNGETCDVASNPCCVGCQLVQNCMIARYTDSPVTIDGDLSEYADVERLSFTAATGSQYTLSWLWDETGIYVACQAVDQTLEAVAIERDGAQWKDDGVEFMFDTLDDGGTSFMPNENDYKFIVSVTGVINDMQGGAIGYGWDAAGIDQAVSVDGTINNATDTDVGYTIEVHVPWESWLSVPQDGDVWGANFFLNDRAAGVHTPTAWVEADGADPNQPDNWGDLVFARP